MRFYYCRAGATFGAVVSVAVVAAAAVSLENAPLALASSSLPLPPWPQHLWRSPKRTAPASAFMISVSGPAFAALSPSRGRRQPTQRLRVPWSAGAEDKAKARAALDTSLRRSWLSSMAPPHLLGAKRQEEEEEEAAAGGDSTTTGARDERIEAEMESLRSVRVTQLRKELNERGIQTHTFIEKSEFVRALAEARVDGVVVPNNHDKNGGGGKSGNDKRRHQPTTPTNETSDKTNDTNGNADAHDPSYRNVLCTKFNRRNDLLALSGIVIDVKLG